VSVAVRAYAAGRVVATSDVIQLAYHPAEPPPGGLDPDPSDFADGFSPSALIPLTLVSVIPASPTTVTLTWTFVGCSHFDRSILEQQSPTGEWDHLAVLRGPGARRWIGSSSLSGSGRPCRVSVHDEAGARALSNEPVSGCAGR
jgi:hypothetical protein